MDEVVKTLKKNIEHLSNKVNNLETALYELNGDSDESTSNVDVIIEELNQILNKNSNFLELFRNNNEINPEKFQSFINTTIYLKDFITTLKTDISIAKENSNLFNLEDQVNSLNESKTKLLEEKSKLVELVDKKTNEIQKIIVELEALMVEHENLKFTYESKVSEDNLDIEEYNNKISLLEKKIKELEEPVKFNGNEVALGVNSNSIVEENNSIYEELKKNYEELKKNYEELKKNHNNLYKKFETLVKEHETLDKEHETLDNKLKTVEFEKGQNERKLQSFIEQFNMMDADCKVIEQEKISLLNEKYMLEVNYHTLQSEHQLLQESFQQLSTVNDDLRSYVGNVIRYKFLNGVYYFSEEGEYILTVNKLNEIRQNWQSEFAELQMQNQVLTSKIIKYIYDQDGIILYEGDSPIGMILTRDTLTNILSNLKTCILRYYDYEGKFHITNNEVENGQQTQILDSKKIEQYIQTRINMALIKYFNVENQVFFTYDFGDQRIPPGVTVKVLDILELTKMLKFKDNYFNTTMLKFKNEIILKDNMSKIVLMNNQHKIQIIEDMSKKYNDLIFKIGQILKNNSTKLDEINEIINEISLKKKVAPEIIIKVSQEIQNNSTKIHNIIVEDIKRGKSKEKRLKVKTCLVELAKVIGYKLFNLLNLSAGVALPVDADDLNILITALESGDESIFNNDRVIKILNNLGIQAQKAENTDAIYEWCTRNLLVYRESDAYNKATPETKELLSDLIRLEPKKIKYSNLIDSFVEKTKSIKRKASQFQTEPYQSAVVPMEHTTDAMNYEMDHSMDSYINYGASEGDSALKLFVENFDTSLPNEDESIPRLTEIEDLEL